MNLQRIRLLELSRLLRIPMRSSDWMVYREFGHQQEIKSLSKLNQLNQTIENRLKSLRVEVDLGKGPVVEESSDVLEETIVKASTIGQIKDLVNFNLRYLESHHVSQLFKSINNIIKYSDTGDDLKYELLGSKEFELLANRTLRVVRHLEASEALNILICLNNLGISSDTFLCQALMQMIRYWINEYPIKDLYQLVRYLKKQDINNSKHSLMKALMLALPYALKHRITYKEIDFYNTSSLLICLEMIAFFGVDVYGDLESLEKCLKFINNQLDSLGLKDLLNLLSFLYEINIKDEDQCLRILHSVIEHCIENITNQDKKALNELPPRFYVNVMMKMRSNKIYYNKSLFDIIAEQAYERKEQFGVQNLYLVLMKNSNFRYINYKMLQFFAHLIESNDPTLWQSNSIVSIINIFRFFTGPCDREEIHSNFTKVAKNAVESNKFEEETTRFKMSYFYFLKHCLILNAKLDQNLIVEWFGSEYLRKALDVCEIEFKKLQFLKTMTTIYQGLFINKNIELNDQNARYIETKLRPYLTEYVNLIRNGLENRKSFPVEQIFSIVSKQFDPNQLKKNYVTPTGLKIDLKIDTDTSIGIILLTAKNFCRDPNTMTGETGFIIQSLKNSNIQPVIVDLEMFNRLTDLEKDVFIKNEITYALKNETLLK